jgi:AAHS family 4-hydroxybenzoate transporter-like MFS transporter
MPGIATTDDARLSRVHLRVTWLCAMVLFLEGYDIAAVGFAIPSLIDAWHVPPSAFTAALTAGSFGLLCGTLIAGPLGDRIGRKPVLVGCVVIFGAFSLATALSGSPPMLSVLRFLTGVGLGGGIPLAIALASDFAPPGTQGRLVILMSAGVSIGNTVGGFLAARLVVVSGWQSIFVVGGLLPLLVVPALLLRLPESAALRAEPAKHNPVAALFGDGFAVRTGLLWVINGLNLLVNYFVLFWTPAIMHSLGESPSRSIIAGTMYALGSILGAFFTAPMVDRIGAERVLTVVLLLGAFSVATIGLVALPFEVLCAVITCAGIGVGGCQHGINSLSGRIYPPQMRSTGAGWALGAGRLGTIGGPLIGGLLLGLGWPARDIFLAAAVPALVVTSSMAILGRLDRERR